MIDIQYGLHAYPAWQPSIRPFSGAVGGRKSTCQRVAASTDFESSSTAVQDRAILSQSFGAADIPISRESVTTQPLATSYRIYRVSLCDALKFSGAPEKVNARLAMAGFLIGAWNEAQTGLTLSQQFEGNPIPPLLFASVFTYATLVPVTKGCKAEAFGPFTPQAEAINGRAAMLGFVVLLCLEWKAGVPFF